MNPFLSLIRPELALATAHQRLAHLASIVVTAPPDDEEEELEPAVSPTTAYTPSPRAQAMIDALRMFGPMHARELGRYGRYEERHVAEALRLARKAGLVVAGGAPKVWRYAA